jgi:hypothetical protein
MSSQSWLSVTIRRIRDFFRRLTPTPDITGSDPATLSFSCTQVNSFAIVGTGFTPHVSVRLEELGAHAGDHLWNPKEATYPSTNGGTRIPVSATPRRFDDSDCGPPHSYTTGDLTVTVSNTQKFWAARSNQANFQVDYHRP